MEPRNQEKLIGHSDAEVDLINALKSQRFHHAWILSGNRGIGKATLAYRLARYILSDIKENDEIKKNLNVPRDSDVFKRVASSSHSDLMTIEREINEKGQLRSEIVVGDVRRINKFINLTPGESSWRIIIIDESETLNRNAENALLKYIEEPPDRTLFLLVTNSVTKLLPTTRSRCRQLTLNPLDPSDVKRFLLQLEICSKINSSDLDILVELSEGSPGKALNILNGEGVELFKKISHLFSQLPEIHSVDLNFLTDQMSRKNGTEIFRLSSELLLWLISKSIKASATNKFIELEKLTGISQQSALINSMNKNQSLDQWVEVWEKVNELFSGVEPLNMDRKQSFCNAFKILSLAAQKP